MSRQRKATNKPTPTTEPTTTKQMTPSRIIRQCIMLDMKATAEAIEAKLAEAGFTDVKKSTISTVRADTMATLRECHELGVLRPAARSRRHDVAAAVEAAAPAAVRSAKLAAPRQ